MKRMQHLICAFYLTTGLASPSQAGPATGAATEWTQLANLGELGALVSTETQSLNTLAEMLGAEFEQIRTLNETYQTMLQNTARLDESFKRDAARSILDMAAVLRQSSALVAEGKNLDAFLRSGNITDPLYDDAPLERAQISERYDRWADQWNSSLSSSLSKAGLTIKDVEQEADLLSSIQSRVGSEDGQLKALQIANELSSSVASQMADLRSLTALQVEQNGVAWGRVLSEQDEAEAKARAFEIQRNQELKRLEQEMNNARGINEILGIGGK